MAERKNNQESKAIGLSLLFLTAGLGVVWIAKSIIKLDGDVVFVSLLIIPVLVYMVLSGKLEEFKGPGGLEARFAKIASQSVSPANQPITPSIRNPETIEKRSLHELQSIRRGIDESKPTVMTMKLGHHHNNEYDRRAVLAYLDIFSQLRNFKLVLFLDQEGNFVAWMPQWSLRGILTQPQLGGAFIDVINFGRRNELIRYPGIVEKAISSKSTNADALREMQEQNLEALVVVDDGRPMGVVEREQILSSMMLALA